MNTVILSLPFFLGILVASSHSLFYLTLNILFRQLLSVECHRKESLLLIIEIVILKIQNDNYILKIHIFSLLITHGKNKGGSFIGPNKKSYFLGLFMINGNRKVLNLNNDTNFTNQFM